MREVKRCAECGVEFIGDLGAKLCPMHEREMRLKMRRETRKYYKQQHMCYDCGRPVEPGKTRCPKCLEKHRRYYNKKRA